jgi:hypothetical protein
MMFYPSFKVVKKAIDTLYRTAVQLVFDTKHKIAHVPPNNNSIRLQLT